jgi:hypothetical protein
MQMTSMRPVCTFILLGLSLGGLSACTSVLLNTPVTKRADGWVVTLNQVKDGPSEYVGDVTVTPGKGEKLIWTILTVKSELSQEETFSYDACVLYAEDRACQPVMVDRNEQKPAAVDRAEAYNPGQERTRLLIYTYPKERRPSRMQCNNIVLPIPAAR